MRLNSRRPLRAFFVRLGNRLSMTRDEMLAVSVVVGIFVAGQIIGAFAEQRIRFGPEYYASVDSLFRALSDTTSPAAVLSNSDTTTTRVDSAGTVLEAAASDSSGRRPVRSALVDLNSASRSELRSLPGIGPKLADRIIHYREQHGRFDSVSDLKRVSGIGDRKLDALRLLVTVTGR